MSIRVICAEEAFICKDFAETNNMLKIVTDFSASVKKVGARTLNVQIGRALIPVAVFGIS